MNKNPIAKKLAEAQSLDRRRQIQIANQVATINRLMTGEHTYDDEMAKLHEYLAVAQTTLEEALQDLKAAKAELAERKGKEA